MQTVKTLKIKLSIIFAITILFSILLLVATSTQANAATTNVNILIKNEPVQFTEQTGKPFIDSNNRTLVPMRVVMEKYGCTVDWEQESFSAIVKKGDIVVKVPTKQKYILVNDNRVEGDTTPQIINGRTYLPVAVVLRAVGADVKWDNNSRSVVVDGAGQGVNPVTTIPAMNVGDSNPAAGVGDKPEGYDEFMKDFEVVEIVQNEGCGIYVKNNKLTANDLETYLKNISEDKIKIYSIQIFKNNAPSNNITNFNIAFCSNGFLPQEKNKNRKFLANWILVVDGRVSTKQEISITGVEFKDWNKWNK